ncbi:hypothetical protein [Cupriavidus sp. D39]|uniref:hypothetical protein n=1 Tax=Cupriavidus sp. D39 TaxID=2997877 RepID=UPI00226E9612|nr:hypothetical protein [Cupriavidus sp. D39]MCY0852667.1 hypothetical protein [Cupriavidus sp. D39]
MARAEYDAYQRRLHPPPPQKSPAERYAEDLAQRAAMPVAPAGAAMAAWYRWFADSAPLQIGGWTLTTIVCHDVTTPETPCVLTYEIQQGAKGLTNRTFLDALPDHFGAPTFLAGDTKASVPAQFPWAPGHPLRRCWRRSPRPWT